MRPLYILIAFIVILRGNLCAQEMQHNVSSSLEWKIDGKCQVQLEAVYKFQGTGLALESVVIDIGWTGPNDDSNIEITFVAISQQGLNQFGITIEGKDERTISLDGNLRSDTLSVRTPDM